MTGKIFKLTHPSALYLHPVVKALIFTAVTATGDCMTSSR